MSITKLSPKWACQMGPIHFINFFAVWDTNCFTIIKCDMLFLRSHEARPGTDPPKSELWEESTLLCPSQNFGEDSLSLSPLIYATDCGLQVLHHFLPTGWLPYP